MKSDCKMLAKRFVLKEPEVKTVRPHDGAMRRLMRAKTLDG